MVQAYAPFVAACSIAGVLFVMISSALSVATRSLLASASEVRAVSLANKFLSIFYFSSIVYIYIL